MTHVRGVTDIGVFHVGGQPSLLISIDRAEAARYGIAAADINNAVQAAVGGAAVTQIIEGERRFDFAVRFTPQFRDTPEAIRKILLPTPDGNQIPLGNVANVALHNGAFMIYREGGRYIPIKFSVRGRDLQSTIEELKDVLAHQVKLPSGYTYTWAGEYDSLQKELHRLAFIVPISPHRAAAALPAVPVLPRCFDRARHSSVWRDRRDFHFGAYPHSFSISAAVGFTSLLGLNTLCTVVFLTGLRHQQHDHGRERGVSSVQSTKCVLSLWPAWRRVSDCCPQPSPPALVRKHKSRWRGSSWVAPSQLYLQSSSWCRSWRARGPPWIAILIAAAMTRMAANPPPDNGPPSPLELGRLLLAQHFKRPLPEDADAGEPPGKHG